MKHVCPGLTIDSGFLPLMCPYNVIGHPNGRQSESVAWCNCLRLQAQSSPNVRPALQSRTGCWTPPCDPGVSCTSWPYLQLRLQLRWPPSFLFSVWWSCDNLPKSFVPSRKDKDKRFALTTSFVLLCWVDTTSYLNLNSPSTTRIIHHPRGCSFFMYMYSNLSWVLNTCARLYWGDRSCLTVSSDPSSDLMKGYRKVLRSPAIMNPRGNISGSKTGLFGFFPLFWPRIALYRFRKFVDSHSGYKHNFQCVSVYSRVRTNDHDHSPPSIPEFKYGYRESIFSYYRYHRFSELWWQYWSGSVSEPQWKLSFPSCWV